MAFDDIKIIGVDKERTHQPDPNMAHYHVYFQLSAHPPHEWSQIFADERKFPRHTMWRRAWIEGKFIVVKCPPDEIKQYHLRDIKQDVDNSNNKYRSLLIKVSTAKAHSQQKQQQKKQALDSALDDLDFD